MRSRRARVMTCLVITALALTGCGKVNNEAKQASSDMLAAELKTQLEKAKFKNVQVVIEEETEPVKPPTSVATPRPKAKSKKIKLLSATASVNDTSPCQANIEQKLNVTSTPYFDEVITPKHPGGIEVVGEKERNSFNPVTILNYVAKHHRDECLVPALRGSSPPA